MYCPNVTVTDAFSRSLDDDSIRKRLHAAAEGERLWLVWIHGKKSRAVSIADELFGKGVSSSPRRYLGDRRVILFTTRAQAETTTSPTEVSLR